VAKDNSSSKVRVLSDKDLKYLSQVLISGVDHKTLAETSGLSEDFIGRVAKDMGLEKKVPEYSAAERKYVLLYLSDGASLEQITRICGVSEGYVRKVAEEEGKFLEGRSGNPYQFVKRKEKF